MRFTATVLSTLALISTVAAQAAHIRLPAAGATVHKGKKVTVQLVRSNGIMGSQEVGLVLSFQPCPKNVCPNVTQQLGDILFIGQYKPQLHPELKGQPYQNFTVTIPNFDSLGNEPAKIIATRFHLFGAGPSPILETDVVNVQLRK